MLPSLLFQHIPLKEYETAWNEGKIDTSKHLHGSNNEDVYSPVVNTGLFDKIVAAGSTKGVFCGHDHANDSAVSYQAYCWPMLCRAASAKAIPTLKR